MARSHFKRAALLTMNDTDLFATTVPVFRHYLLQINVLMDRVEEEGADLFNKLVADTFSAAQHFHIAQGYVQRTVFPVIGRSIPSLSDKDLTADGLRKCGKEVLQRLDVLTPDDFTAASGRVITHRAGEADLKQSASDYVTLYAVPNFFFHLTMGYATLRQRGLEIGKADFDGHHRYQRGFRFDA